MAPHSKISTVQNQRWTSCEIVASITSILFNRDAVTSNPGCPHVTEFDDATVDLIEFIYTHYPVPLPKVSSAYNSVPPETCPLRSGERLLHPLIYPVDWPIDRSILSKAVRDFLNGVENRLRTLLPFVNWQAKRPVKPTISDALGRPKIRHTRKGISDPSAIDLSSELPFIPVIPAEPFRINLLWVEPVLVWSSSYGYYPYLCVCFAYHSDSYPITCTGSRISSYSTNC
jgi:hypothetical protein